MSLRVIRFRSIQVRLAAVAIVAVVVVFSFLNLVWGFASTVSAGADNKEVGALLAELSPGDPQTHFASAVLHEKTFEPADLQTALREYEAAAALSPHNYLSWLELGTALDRAGEKERAETALRRAHALAPNYPRVAWALGNFLLRDGRNDEAYAELRKAVAGDASFAAAVATVALQMSDGDAQLVRSRLENSYRVNASLALLLAQQKRFDEAAELWKTVPVEDEKTSETAKTLRQLFLEEKKFRAAIAINSGNGIPISLETITNPGFESVVKIEGADAFDWRVPATNCPQFVITDAQKRSGKYSLIAVFNIAEPCDFRSITQLVAVRPARAYTLNAAYRADLKAKAAFQLEIVSAADGKRLAVSTPLEHSTGWAELSINFSVPQETDGIEIRLIRGECVGLACSATGNLWFDDLSLVAK